MNALALHYQREAERDARRQALRYRREFWGRKQGEAAQ